MSTISNKPLFKSQVNGDEKIGRYNFELVMKFIIHSIQKNPDAFNEIDLLTLAKFTVVIYFDHHCGKMINVIQTLFRTCIETAFRNGDEISIISFDQELSSQNL